MLVTWLDINPSAPPDGEGEGEQAEYTGGSSSEKCHIALRALSALSHDIEALAVLDRYGQVWKGVGYLIYFYVPVTDLR